MLWRFFRSPLVTCWKLCTRFREFAVWNEAFMGWPIPDRAVYDVTLPPGTNPPSVAPLRRCAFLFSASNSVKTARSPAKIRSCLDANSWAVFRSYFFLRSASSFEAVGSTGSPPSAKRATDRRNLPYILLRKSKKKPDVRTSSETAVIVL